MAHITGDSVWGAGAAEAVGAAAELRISDVMQETGLSKELIHHYLRQGLVPRPDARGRYTGQHVRLLELIRTLREDHNLPLEVIRSIFEAFDFAPDRLETLTLSESLCKRIMRFADGGLMSTTALSRAELTRLCGLSADRLGDYVRAGIVTARTPNGDESYSSYDANVIALCERGLELGIPFESFRTAASYVHVAFELEKAGFFGRYGPEHEAAQIFAELFLRREVVISFVQNMLQAVTQLHFHADFTAGSRYELTLEDIVYEPSQAFVQRHGLEQHIDRARSGCVDAQGPDPWLHVARLLTHVARYHEAVFLLEDSLRRWPTAALRAACGRAQLLAGDSERGAELLAAIAVELPADPLVPTYLALASFKHAAAQRRPEALVDEGATILRHVNEALERLPNATPAARLESQIFCGWLLCAVPQVFDCRARGLRLLGATLAELATTSLPSDAPPGLVERLRVNAAFLLFQSLDSDDGDAPSPNPEPGDHTPLDIPSREQLRTLICRLDPACSFAQAVFLDAAAAANREGAP